MFTNDQTVCDHNSINIEIEQEEMQEFDVDPKKLLLTKIHDDINSSEPLKIICNDCHLNLNYEDIAIEDFVIIPLLDKENIDIIHYILKERTEENNDDECEHEQVSLELYQIIQYNLLKEQDGSYKIKETNFTDKEVYLICQQCSTILYENLEDELRPLNSLESTDEDFNEDELNLNNENENDDDSDPYDDKEDDI